MKINWSAALKNGLLFCFYPKRWLPFFIIDLVIISGILAFIYYNLSSIISALLSVTDVSLLLGYLVPIISIVILGIVWILVNLWVTGAIIHQSYKIKEFKQSWGVAGKRYLPLLGAMVVIGVITYLIGLVPYVGWILTIIVSLIFFFAYQGIIIKNSGFYEALKGSWQIFRQRPLKVFIMWLLIGVISLLIVGVFSIPIIIVIWNILLTTIAGQESALLNLLLSIESSMPFLIVTGIIFLMGTAISKVFSLKAQTEFYLQIKKRFKVF